MVPVITHPVPSGFITWRDNEGKSHISRYRREDEVYPFQTFPNRTKALDRLYADLEKLRHQSHILPAQTGEQREQRSISHA